MARHLTARNVTTLPVPSEAERQADYWDTTLKGFGLRVSYGGQRAWVLRYTVDGTGRRRRKTIGDVATLSLAKAREKARRMLRQAAEGVDPVDVQEEREEAGTFGELAALYLKDHAKPGKKSWKDDKRTINAELLAKNRANWRHVKVCDLKRKMIRDMFRAITDRDAPVMANRTLALVSTMLNYALVELEWIEANPAARLKKNKEKPRARVLSDDEIRELWAAIHETKRFNEHKQRIARLNATLNDAFKMRFCTVQRGAEVFQMRWPDLDLDAGWWEIPGEYTKNGEIHRVPLIAPAVELLKARKANARPDAVWVFEGLPPRIAGREFGNVYARGKRAAAFLSRGDAHLKNKRVLTRKRLPYLPGLSFEFRGHDIRRTVSTNMTKAGVPRDHVSKVLNHVDRGARATKVYDRYEYDVEKRGALETWARRLDAILRPPKQSHAPSVERRDIVRLPSPDQEGVSAPNGRLPQRDSLSDTDADRAHFAGTLAPSERPFGGSKDFSPGEPAESLAFMAEVHS